MKYSICATNYNTERVIEKHLDSIFRFITPQNFEVVIVDNKSTDDSPEILRKYAKDYGNMNVISEKCLRGRGRQIAFENSSGKYIIQVDTDTIYRLEWKKFIEAYEKKNIDIAVQAVFSGIFPRRLIEEVGGWRNLNYAEDLDLWLRLLKINNFKWYPLIVGDNYRIEGDDPELRQTTSVIERIYRNYIRSRDRMRVNRTFNGLRKDTKQWAKPHKYYLFWLPLLSLASTTAYFSSFKSDYNFTKEVYERNIIDLGVAGEKVERWFSFETQ